jgi:glucose/arabinose dehydrogenase
LFGFAILTSWSVAAEARLMHRARPAALLIGHGQTHKWSVYREPASGAVIDYPSDLLSVDAGPPETGPGKTFRTPDGHAQLSLYALTNDRNETPAAFLGNHMAVDRTNLQLNRVTSNFFSFSGSAGDHKFFSRCNFPKRSSYIHCMLLQYPIGETKVWDAIASRMSRSLHGQASNEAAQASEERTSGMIADAEKSADKHEPVSPDTRVISPAARPDQELGPRLHLEASDPSRRGEPLVTSSATHADVRGPSNAPKAEKEPAGLVSESTKLPDQQLGRRFHFEHANLPSIVSGPAVGNSPVVLPYKGQVPRVPEGFTATPFAIGLANPRRLLVLPNGDVLVAEQFVGYLTLLRDDDGDGRADWIERYSDGFRLPYGLAWQDDVVLVADQDGIWKIPHELGAVRPSAKAVKKNAKEPDRHQALEGGESRQMITAKDAFGLVAGHHNRPLAIDPHTGALLVGVGSSGNLGIEPPVKATIQRFAADGSHQTTFAAGMRNPTAMAFHPQTGELFAVVQERDGLGDDLPSDYLTHVQQDAFYGWPYAYIGPHPQPGFAERAPEKVSATITPDLMFQAHSSVLDLVFYQGDQFPRQYRGSIFVALKGSWNRSEPTGYKVVRVPFKDGRPEGYYENFVTGFWVSGERQAEVWGRPAALAVAKDGALLIADDTGGTIWRIAYTGDRR